MKNLRMSLAYFIVFFATEGLALQRNIVLVPGYFNSMILGHIPWDPGPDYKPYWSGDIVKTLATRGDDVFVVDTFDPFGSIEDNGRSLSRFLKKMSGIREWQQRETIIIAHSAGGLYALSALNELELDNISYLVTIGTPFLGLDHSVAHLDRSALGDWIPFDGLMELSRLQVEKFIRGLRLKTVPKIIVFAGQQESPNILEVNNPRFLSWPLAIFSQTIRGPSDGFVSTDSALARDVDIKNTQEESILIGRWPQVLPLDHFEQVQDYKLSRLLGTSQLSYVRSQQRQFYSDLLEIL